MKHIEQLEDFLVSEHNKKMLILDLIKRTDWYNTAEDTVVYVGESLDVLLKRESKYHFAGDYAPIDETPFRVHSHGASSQTSNSIRSYRFCVPCAEADKILG